MHKKTKKTYLVISFYSFFKIKNPLLIKELILNSNKERKIKGTVIISVEGINGSISGDMVTIKKVFKIFCKFSTQEFIKNVSFVKQIPFSNFKVKIKEEILKIGINNRNFKNKKGKYIDPVSWDRFCSDKDAIILDTRNSYESEIGYFKNSILPNIKSFSEFPNWVTSNWDTIKNKKILTYCTGGIRCEKASSFLISLGITEVYQLKGGILKYLKKKKNGSKFSGECFVFDDRVTLDKKLNKGKYNICYACGSAITKVELMSDYFEKGISCPKCIDKTTELQKKSFQERQKQILLSQKRGTKYITKI